jgi:hypothetical protein
MREKPVFRKIPGIMAQAPEVDCDGAETMHVALGVVLEVTVGYWARERH